MRVVKSNIIEIILGDYIGKAPILSSAITVADFEMLQQVLPSFTWDSYLKVFMFHGIIPLMQQNIMFTNSVHGIAICKNKKNKKKTRMETPPYKKKPRGSDHNILLVW